ncbi:hypothetical protein, partial [Paramuribaculum intestinale]|uniref:hypothetical protein n=1 Tax=Paramuribaculum intestinale TaxID=2094151 RepID=UPI0025A94056
VGCLAVPTKPCFACHGGVSKGFAVYDRCLPPVMPWPPLLTVLQVGGEGCLGQWCPSLRSG